MAYYYFMINSIPKNKTKSVPGSERTSSIQYDIENVELGACVLTPTSGQHTSKSKFVKFGFDVYFSFI